MAIAITGILFILGIVFKKSKSVYFAEFVWMWILLSFCNNVNRHDYQNYRYSFNYIKDFGITVKNSEIGYSILCKSLSDLGMDFEQALSIMMFLFLVILAISIPVYTDAIARVASFFMIYPLFMCGIQIRNSIAMSIIIFAFRYLIDSERYSIWKYFICVILAAMFQTTAIIYFILPLVRFLSKKNIKYFALLFAGVITIVSRMDIDLLRKLFGEGRYEAKFFGNQNTIQVLLISALWQISMTMLLYLLHVKVKETKEYRKIDERMKLINEIIIKINLIFLIIIPLYYIDFSVERLYRNIMVLNFIFIASCIQIGMKKDINVLFCYMGLVGWYICTCVFFEGVYANNWENYVSGYLMENDMMLHGEKYIFLWMVLGGLLGAQIILEKKKVHFVLHKKVLRE